MFTLHWIGKDMVSADDEGKILSVSRTLADDQLVELTYHDRVYFTSHDIKTKYAFPYVIHATWDDSEPFVRSLRDNGIRVLRTSSLWRYSEAEAYNVSESVSAGRSMIMMEVASYASQCIMKRIPLVIIEDGYHLFRPNVSIMPAPDRFADIQQFIPATILVRKAYYEWWLHCWPFYCPRIITRTPGAFILDLIGQ